MAQALMFQRHRYDRLVNPRNLPEVQGDKRFVLQPYNALSYSFFGYNAVRNPLLVDPARAPAITVRSTARRCSTRFFNSQGHDHLRPVRARQLGIQPRRQALAVRPGARARAAHRGASRPAPTGSGEGRQEARALASRSPSRKRANDQACRARVQNYLKNAGIAITVEFKEWQAWKEDVFLEHNFDIMFASWCSDDSADISSLFHSAEIATGRTTSAAIPNPEVDGLIVESKLTLDHEKRPDDQPQLHSILAEEQPYTFLWTLTNYSAYHKKVRPRARSTLTSLLVRRRWFIPASEQK